MGPRTTFTVATNEPALILYWPVADGGLWDPEVSALVESLEDDLEIFVTCVGSGRGALGLNDAAAAARFMGCSAVVVVSPESCHPSESELEEVAAGFQLPVVEIRSEWTVSALAEAYHEARRHASRAA